MIFVILMWIFKTSIFFRDYQYVFFDFHDLRDSHVDFYDSHYFYDSRRIDFIDFHDFLNSQIDF